MMELRLCRFNLHQPRPGRTAWDEDCFTYTGECRHCGETIASSSAHRWVKAVAPENTDSAADEYFV